MNWQQRMAAAEDRGYFTDEDKLAVSDWRTCVCGEQKGIPKSDGTGTAPLQSPLDNDLREHGYKFYKAVLATAEEKIPQMNARELATARKHLEALKGAG